MMQKRFFVSSIFLLLIANLFLSCNNSTSSTSTEDAAANVDPAQLELEKKWIDLKEEYHTVMAGTFHPAEDGNFEPVKTMYGDLAEKAALWAEAPIPEKYSDKNFDESLSDLVKEAKAIGEKVENGATDEELSKALYNLHDVFHVIQGQCEDEH